MPRRVSQTQIAATKASSRVGKAHIEVESWRNDILAPACAKRGQGTSEFLLLSGDPNKLDCPVCSKSFMEKNEKDKHRHELSLSHRRACAQKLQLPDDELGAGKSAQTVESADRVCQACHITFTRVDGLRRHHRKMGHWGSQDICSTNAKRNTRSQGDTNFASSSSMPSTPTQSLASGSPSPFSYPSSLAPISPPAPYLPLSMSLTSSLGSTPPLTEHTSSSDSSSPPTPLSSTNGLLDCNQLSLLLQALSPSDFEHALEQIPMSEPVFYADTDFPSTSYLCAQDSWVSGGSAWGNLSLLCGTSGDSAARENFLPPPQVDVDLSGFALTNDSVECDQMNFLDTGNFSSEDFNLGELNLDDFNFDDYINY